MVGKLEFGTFWEQALGSAALQHSPQGRLGDNFAELRDMAGIHLLPPP